MVTVVGFVVVVVVVVLVILVAVAVVVSFVLRILVICASRDIFLVLVF